MNAPAPNRGPLHDDGPLPDLISGLMWLATSVVGVAVLALPGTPHPHLAVALVLLAIPTDLISLKSPLYRSLVSIGGGPGRN